MDKQAYALVKSLKHFKMYVGYSKVITYVPHPTIKAILAQQDCLGTRGKWVTKIQKYNLKIVRTKFIKGIGLAQKLAQGNEVALGLQDDASPMILAIIEELEHHDWALGGLCFHYFVVLMLAWRRAHL
jgi:hypothetical protein